MRKAFTLVELLVVIAILALLAGIIFPVMGRAKSSAQATSCLSHIRQIGLGMLLYREQEDGFARDYGFARYRQTGFLPKNDEFLLCPQDRYGGMASREGKCRWPEVQTPPTSFYSPFRVARANSGGRTLLDALLTVDPNPAIVVCRSHGKATRHHSVTAASQCKMEAFAFAYDERLLRMRLDGSAASVPFTLYPPGRPSYDRETFHEWSLYTDKTLE